MEIVNGFTIKNMLHEYAKYNDPYKVFLKQLDKPSIVSVVNQIGADYVIPKTRLSVSIKGEFKRYDTLLQQLTEYIQQCLSNDSEQLANELVNEIHTNYNKIIMIKLNKTSVFHKQMISVCINKYIICGSKVFFISCKGFLQFKKRLGHSAFNYKYNSVINITGIIVPTVNRLEEMVNCKVQQG
jgi:hypothetical protein